MVDPGSFKLELPDFERLKPVELKKFSKTEVIRMKKTKSPKFEEPVAPKFEKPSLKADIKSKREKSFLKLKKLDKSSKTELINLKQKLQGHEKGVKLISVHIKEQAGKVGDMDKTLSNLSREFKNLKVNMLTVSTFDNFSRQIKGRLSALDKVDKEVSKRVALIKDLKRKMDDKYSLNLKITSQMQERMVEFKKKSNDEAVQENLSKMMVFLQELTNAFNNSVSIRDEIKKKIIEHDGKIRELVETTEKPFDIEEYLKRV